MPPTENGVFDNENPNYKQGNKAKSLYLWIQSVLESVMAAFLLLTFLFRINIVAGSSMEPTLREEDRIVVSQAFYSPSYGDIVALWAEDLFNRRTGEKGEMIVKRVIGLPGDIIDIDPATGTVYRNGEPLREDYTAEPINADNLGNAEYPLTVEVNCVFVLGDNRNHSTDSRYVDDGETEYYVGCVDMRYIAGKAVFRIYPFDRIGVL
ncbi:MAG: signal peptidase I [Oscillospiraceae bacterium]|nr:signal peptidase I [Oscillospiraceae bacterium]